jgi:GH25 family lysozyme M1 (1,4-beta-N-acetylmuramidase)
MGHYQTLAQQGWQVAPIYVGEQATGGFSPNATEGTADGRQAVSETSSQGFAKGTVIYFDVETAGNPGVNELAYIKAWAVEVQAEGYTPGIYCLLSAYSYIDKGLGTLAPNVPFWISNPKNPSPHGLTFPTGTMNPSQSGDPSATAWQYETASNYNITGIPISLIGSGHLHVDLDTILV